MMQKKRPDFNNILRSILLILGIVLMLLKISARASAEEMAENIQESVWTAIHSINNSSQYDAYIEQAMSECPYILQVNRNNVQNCFYFSNYPEAFISAASSRWYIPFSNIDSGKSSISVSFPYEHSDIKIWAFSFADSSYFNILKFYGDGTFYSTSPYVPYGTRTYILGRSEDFSYNNMTFPLAFGDWKLQNYTITDNIVPVPSVDDRFNAYVSLDQSQRKQLNITWDSQAYPNTGNFVYESSTIALQVAVNGQSSTVSFSSIDYPDLFVSGNSSYIPYKFIQKLANIATVQPSDTFYLEKITLTQQAYPSAAGPSAIQSFTASTVYSLNLGEDVVEIPNIQQVQNVSVNYTQIVSGTDFAVSSGTSVTPPDWANILSIAICDYTSAGGSTTINDPSLYDYIFMKDNGAMTLYSSTSSDFNLNIFVNGLTASSTEVSVPYQQGLSLFYKDFLPQLFDSYDVVLISMNSISGNTATVTDSYYYTASYYSKLSIRSLGNLQSGVEAAAYYGKALYDYSFQRFNGIAESLEGFRLSSNNLLSSINANILNLQDLVSGGTDRIVNAISGISGGSGGGISVSDLSDTLNTLFMPSFEWDTINYQDYLDSIGVLALPFEFVFDTQSIIKSNYSASLVMPINDFSVPLGKDQNNNNLEFTVFEDHEDFTFSPTSIFPAAIWSVFQYLAAFGLVIGEAWFTYVHIFRKEEKSGDF